MGSQTDLDQGGTFRQWVRTYMGPSVGWVFAPFTNTVPVVTGGTTTIVQGVTLVPVAVAALVTIQLPSAFHAAVNAGVKPGTYLGFPLTIVDAGGHADAFPITVLPAAGETIIGLASVQITSQYGALILQPDIELGGWVFR